MLLREIAENKQPENDHENNLQIYIDDRYY
jgi:hypothetical protein